MLFNSTSFLVFFPVVTFLYFLFPHRLRWGLLLLASCVFYMAFIPSYILILATTIVVDYFAGIEIEKSTGRRKRLFLILSILSNIGFLAFFKYAGFLDANIAAIAKFFDWNYSLHALGIILPVGLSFHTFQALSYIIEVYRGKQKAERHFGIYALYVMFFPQLVAGPIERPQNLLHQFREVHRIDKERMWSGLRLMLWGFFKKVAVADTLAQGVNVIYNNTADFTGTSFIIATIFFAFQIYCDFSGYSDIARGSARVLGFRLMLNFNSPYHSRSISEFWTRWHISLSTWFRDYVYISLGGNRVSKLRMYMNLLIVFIVSGFWHGANWTFIIWGALHGIYLVSSLLLKNFREGVARLFTLDKYPLVRSGLAIATTFVLVNIGWVFFRANSVGDAFYVVTHLFMDLSADSYSVTLTRGTTWMYSALLGIAAVLAVEIVRSVPAWKACAIAKPAYMRGLGYAVLLIVILLSGNTSENQFIYFQF